MKAMTIIVSNYRVATAPPQLEPAPAVQPKQCEPVMMRRHAEGLGIEIGDCLGQFPHDAEIQHLVEVTVVESASPVDADQIAAHQAIDSRGIECLNELAHVAFFVSRATQIIKEPFDWHIRDREELVERNTVTIISSLLKSAPMLFCGGGRNCLVGL